MGENMDIAELDLNYIRILALAYSNAMGVFGVRPVQAVPKKQKQICKWVKNTYIDNDFPKNVLDFFHDSNSNLEILEFMEKCFLLIQEQEKEKKQIFEQAIIAFSEDVKNSFLCLFDQLIYSTDIQYKADTIVFKIEERYAYTRMLVLYGTDYLFDDEFDELYFKEVQTIEEKEGYRLICLAVNYEQEREFPLALFFRDAKVETKIFRADQRPFDNMPWETLTWMVLDILDKECLGNEYFNQKEQDLRPLMKEIKALLNKTGSFYDDQFHFVLLKQYFEKYKLHYLKNLLVKVEENYADSKKKIRLLNKLNWKLNQAICEPLWRELYQLLVDSQKDYAGQIELYNGFELQKKREEIQTKLRANGYEGQYPNFRKKGSIRGVRLEESYGLYYFISGEKNVEYYIQCRENIEFNQLQIQFLCGTAVLKKREKVKDIYSCCFNAKGKRFFKTVQYEEIGSDEEENVDVGTLEQMITIAVKKAECVKLNKEEKQIYYQDKALFEKNFIFIFLFMGGLFGVLMTAAMFICCCVETAITVGIDKIPEMISDMPWWLLFGLCFVGYGGGMAILEIKAKTK